METLVLSDSWMPLNRVSWQKAIGWVVTGRVVIVEAYEDRVIRSIDHTWPMPSVVRFVYRVSSVFVRNVKFSRKNVWVRDKGRCQYCSLKVSLAEFTFDHVVPKHQGGRTRWENVVVCCHPCNQRKKGHTPEQAGMRLRLKPVRPKSLPGTYSPVLAWSEDMPETWRDYLRSFQYWHGKLDQE